MAEIPEFTIWSELMGVPFTIRYINAGGVSTRILEAGKGDPLVLLHGTSGHIEAYARNIADLAQSHYVIAYDMIGHGLTEKPDCRYTLEVYTGHLTDVLGALRIGVCSLSGDSLGAWVAAWFASHAPDRV